MKPLEITRHYYPVEPTGQRELIGLWRSAWTRTDYNWLEALYGDYSETLTLVSLVARIAGQPVSTATVSFAKSSPEICVLGNVVTLEAFRGRGLGARLTESAATCGFEAGCKVAYLGSSRMQGNLYERCGFARLAGCIMCRHAPGHGNCDVEFFANGQATEIRSAVWGDLPGLVSLLTQPLGSVVIDYSRSLISMKFADPLRCVSAFAVVHDEIKQRGGAMLMLASKNGSRVLGMGTLTPGPGPSRAHWAMVDAAAHDNYHQHMDEMLVRLRQEAANRDIEVLRACVAVSDAAKISALSRAGFQPIVRLPSHLRLRSGTRDAILLESRVVTG